MYCGFENYVLSSQLTKQIVFTTRRIIYIMFDIITDSACDIVREYAETHNLKLVPLYTTFDGVNYLKEQYDITHDEFYRRMTDEGAFPKSSLPSVQDFVDAILPSVEAGRPAIVCTITSYFSGSYNSACTAKDIILEDHPDAKVTVINSLLNSASFSLFIYQALQMRKAGYSYEDTIKVLEALRNDGRIMFTTESLEYLSKGGRLAKTAITITSKLSLRPIIVMKEGEIGLGGFTRTRNKGKSNVIDMIQKYIESKGMPIENWDITVGYCTNLEEAEKYRDDVEAQLGVKLLERREDFKTRISIISGCHTGPYALGIACIPKYTTIRL